ncbi:Chromosome transmission fidelity protein 18 [Microbotryomycetes sp. JL201]|nr:Chromosome transmission fidelity protein 18 [Microbotryomycetes sp. JL201]
MQAIQARPLSPSRLANTASSAAPSARKPFVFEEDDDFYAEAALAEAEMPGNWMDAGPQTPHGTLVEHPDDVETAAHTRASPRQHTTSQEYTAMTETRFEREDTVMAPRPDIKAGKRRLLLELGDDFGGDEFSPVEIAAESYDAHSRAFLDLRPGQVEMAPIAATTMDGKRVTFNRKRKSQAWAHTPAQKASNGPLNREDAHALVKLAGTMLETPYHRMVEEIKLAKVAAQKQAAADETNGALVQKMALDSASEVEAMLWTDRYRPKRFTQLLGDERVHRNALLWLKEWDECVFRGVNSKSNHAADLKREKRKKRAREGTFNSTFGAAKEQRENNDPFGRPFEKVMLLSGPPGLGKTTLAHVLARQAGYQVLEINASDDRTGKVVEERIRNALESTALTKEGGLAGSRPTCVVIDEVDGAGGGGETSFVRTLVKLVTEGSNPRSFSKSKGKGKKDRPLLRPIICICNDLYAPTLRPLRPLAKVIRFNAPTNAMLVTRLRDICDDEGLRADAKNLMLLAEVSEGDLRSCLNTLQFIKRRSSVVDEAAIRSTLVGTKDTGTSLSQVIERLFRKPPRKKGRSADDKFVNRIVRDVQTSGEYDKISQGCFENYLGAKTMTDTWPKIDEALDWMFLYDRLDGKLRADRDYELLAYVPYTFVPWHKLFSSYSSEPLAFPTSDYEAYLKRTAHQEIAQVFTTGMPHGLKNLFTATNVCAELLPYLNRIISPDLKPVNNQLIKSEERTVLNRLVSTLLSTQVSFVQEKDEDGQIVYKLEPPIDVFVHFDGKRATDIGPARYAVRHMVTREMEAELIRRAEGGIEALSSATDILAAYKAKPVTAKSADVKEAVDFFGRVIAAKPLSASQAVALDKSVQAPQAAYRFNEGFSNAVRTTKKMSLATRHGDASSRPALSVRTSSESATAVQDGDGGHVNAPPQTPHVLPPSIHDRLFHDSPVHSLSAHAHESASPTNSASPATAPLPRSAVKHRRLDSTVTSSRIFEQLDVIKKLQSDITQAHASTEGVGLGPAGQNEYAFSGHRTADWPFKTSEPDAKSPNDRGKAAASANVAESESSSSQTYEDMAREFDKRQEGVERMMSKLADLSNALKELHSLPSPVLFPSSTGKHRNTAAKSMDSHNSPDSPIRPSRDRASSQQ